MLQLVPLISELQGSAFDTALRVFKPVVFQKGEEWTGFEVELWEKIAQTLNIEYEHKYQPLITSMVVNGQISWDGKNPKSLKVPKGYKWLKK
tara:strand:- start:2534 stop:2809 length:276 start_codon:yes stop_codon:yes gene_type:complete